MIIPCNTLRRPYCRVGFSSCGIHGDRNQRVEIRVTLLSITPNGLLRESVLPILATLGV